MIKSDDAVQQVKEVINYYNYFTSDEKIQFQQNYAQLIFILLQRSKTSGRYVFKASIVCKSIDRLPET